MNEQKIEQKLVSLLKRDKKTFAKQKKVSSSYRNFLKNFSSFKKFKGFLSRCTDEDVKSFYLDIKKDILDNGSYKKFLNFCNYTTNNQRILIMVTYYNYFGNIPKRTMTKIVTKGIIGKSLKSKRKKATDTGTLKEYIHIVEVPLGEVTRFLKFNAGRLRAEVGIDYETEYEQKFGRKMKVETKKYDTVPGTGVFKSIKQKKIAKSNQHFARAGMTGIIKDYSYLRTYTFKQINHPLISAFRQKNLMKTLVRNKRNRAVKFEEKTGQDWSVILNFFRKTGTYQFADEFSQKAKSEMTLAFKMLKLKKYSGLSENIVSTNKIDRMIAKDSAKKFVKEFQKKILTHKHIK